MSIEKFNYDKNARDQNKKAGQLPLRIIQRLRNIKREKITLPLF